MCLFLVKLLRTAHWHLLAARKAKFAQFYCALLILDLVPISSLVQRKRAAHLEAAREAAQEQAESSFQRA